METIGHVAKAGLELDWQLDSSRNGSKLRQHHAALNPWKGQRPVGCEAEFLARHIALSTARRAAGFAPTLPGQ